MDKIIFTRQSSLEASSRILCTTFRVIISGAGGGYAQGLMIFLLLPVVVTAPEPPLKKTKDFHFMQID
jgi:hypothetical protein